MNSMTGFGSATHRHRRLDIEAEMRSVNHRFITLKQSLPNGLSRHESDIDEMIRKRLNRGSVTLSVSVKSRQPMAPSLPNLKALRETCEGLRKIRKTLGLKGDVHLADLMSVPGLWADAQSREPQADLWPRVRKLVAEALNALVAMREREGATIERDLQARLSGIEERLDRIRVRTPLVTASYEKRLDDRVQAILTQKGLEVAKPDLAKEVALHADRCDISEELQRLGAHAQEFRKILKIKGQVGRRLDFLTQEMVRETNTIASKGNDAEISACAVEIKAEIEKIKEQVENVE